MQEILSQVISGVLLALIVWIANICWAQYRRIKRIRKDIDVAFDKIRILEEHAGIDETVDPPKRRRRKSEG